MSVSTNRDMISQAGITCYLKEYGRTYRKLKAIDVKVADVAQSGRVFT